jgi:type I restriction enzyme R subunit
MFNEENTVEQMVRDTLCGGVTSNRVAEEPEDYPQITQINADENQRNNLRESAKSADKYSWRFVAAEELPRQHSDVLVESMVRDALIRLNPEIKAQPDRADEVLSRLPIIPLSMQSGGLVRTNELFAEWLSGETGVVFQ